MYNLSKSVNTLFDSPGAGKTGPGKCLNPGGFAAKMRCRKFFEKCLNLLLTELGNDGRMFLALK